MGTVQIDDLPFKERIDYSGTNVPRYQGWALPGNESGTGPNTGSAVWRIVKFTVSGTNNANGVITAKDWADGNTQFDNSWDDRGSGAYS